MRLPIPRFGLPIKEPNENGERRHAGRFKVRGTGEGGSAADSMTGGSHAMDLTENRRGVRSGFSRLLRATRSRFFSCYKPDDSNRSSTPKTPTEAAAETSTRHGPTAAACLVAERVMNQPQTLCNSGTAGTESYGITSEEQMTSSALDSAVLHSRIDGPGAQTAFLEQSTESKLVKSRRRSTGDWRSRNEIQHGAVLGTGSAFSGISTQSIRPEQARASGDGESNAVLEDHASHGSIVKDGETLKDLVLGSEHSQFAKTSAIYDVLRIICRHHRNGIVIGTLNLDGVRRCSTNRRWKLGNLQDEPCLASRALAESSGTHEAPELSEARKNRDFSRVGKPADMWSLGLIILELFTGKEHHCVLHHVEHLRQYVRNEIRDLDEDEVDCDALEELLNGLLCKAPESRLTIEEVSQTKFFRRNFGSGQRLIRGTYPFLKSLKSRLLDAGLKIASRLNVHLALRRLRRNVDKTQGLDKITSRTCSIRDSTLPSDPVYTRSVAESTFLEIEIDTSCPTDFRRLEDVRLSIDGEKEPAELKAVAVNPGGRSLKSIAALDAENLTSKKLCRPSRWFGSEKDKYAQLEVDFTVVNRSWPGNFRLSSRVFVKVIGRRILLLFDQIPHLCKKATDGLPQCARSVCKAGATIVSFVPVP